MSLKLDEHAVMGILNVTPDSFFDGGRFLSEERIMQRVNSMEYDGVDIVDVGGYSSRPNAKNVPEEEELNRVLPVIKLIRSNFRELKISIDTFRSKVALECLDAGANMVNDISGGTMDKKMFGVVAQSNSPYILSHIQGTPSTMQDNPSYTNVVEEVNSYFGTKLEQLRSLGVSNIILDPGFGFGKTVEHNYELLSQLQTFSSFKLPILVGLSRKSMINKVIRTDPEEALNGTTVLNTIALTNGATVLRVHDVKEARQAITLVNKLNKL